MSLNGYLIPGKQYTLNVAFPWERGVAIEVAVLDRTGKAVDGMTWRKEIPRVMMQQYGAFIPMAKKIISSIFER